MICIQASNVDLKIPFFNRLCVTMIKIDVVIFPEIKSLAFLPFLIKLSSAT